MDLISIIIISIGLAMDCFAVSVSKGMCAKKIKWKYTLRMAFLFGLFQGIMPLISFLAGSGLADRIKSFDHWIAFFLLVFIGIKMLVEGLKPVAPDCKADKHPFKWKNLLLLSLATSIDALATGIILIPYPGYIEEAVIIIALTSFTFSITGMKLGIRFRNHLKFNFELAGGIILIVIGTKILIEHIWFIDCI